MVEEELEESSGTPIDFNEIKGMVRRRRWQFLVPFFLGWALVWGGSWRIKSTYRSGTLILVEDPSVSEKYVVSNIDTDIQHQLDSITQQILSRTRLIRIIDKLGLYPDLRKKHVNPDDLVEGMTKNIDIELSRGDDRKLSAFNIYYTNSDPHMAQAATAELANLFITENLEERTAASSNTTKFLEDQLQQARDKLAAQELKLRQFKDQHLGELPTQTQGNLQILSTLQTQLQGNVDALDRARQQNTYLESLLNQYRSMDTGGKGGEAAGAPGLADIDKQLDTLKSQLADLTSHYTDKHPDVRKTREQIARMEAMRARLVADQSSQPEGAAPEAQPGRPIDARTATRLEMESQLKANRQEIANREGVIRQEEQKIEQYQARLNMAPVMEQQFADVSRDYDQSKTEYDQLLAKKNQSQQSTDLEKTQQGERFRMLDPPNLPLRPYKPNRLVFCIAGIAAGLVFGGGYAFAQERLSGKVYSERELKKLVPFEIIAEIPPIESAEELQQRLRGTLIAGAAAAAILACILLGSAYTYLYG